MATRLRAEVNWMLNWANCPEVEVYWDKFPDYEALRYEERNGMYRAESADGDVSFYYWRGPHNENGFGGRTFDITMVNGTVRQLKGPWSSNADKINQIFYDRKSVNEVTYCVDRGHKDFHGDQLYSRVAAAMTVEAICHALKIPIMNYKDFMVWLLQTKDEMRGDHYNKNYIERLKTTGSMWG